MSPHLNSCADRCTGKGDLKFCLKPCLQIQKNPSCSAQQAQMDPVSQTGLPQGVTQHRTALQTHQTWSAPNSSLPMPPGHSSLRHGQLQGLAEGRNSTAFRPTLARFCDYPNLSKHYSHLESLCAEITLLLISKKRLHPSVIGRDRLEHLKR